MAAFKYTSLLFGTVSKLGELSNLIGLGRKFSGKAKVADFGDSIPALSTGRHPYLRSCSYSIRRRYSDSVAPELKQIKKKKKAPVAEPTPAIERLNREVDTFRVEEGLTPLPKFGRSEYTTRTHTCGELTSDDVGKTVTLSGWLTFKRLNGKFMVLRDLYGVTQIYVPAELKEQIELAARAPLESVLEIVGTVALRPESQQKKDQVSGEIEIVTQKITILSEPADMRLSYNDYDKADEELCIRYRYLYLRNSKAQTILRNKATFLSKVRKFMDENHFIDIETPTLIRRTPGGAREFPVATKFKDSYFALAQSPQLLKQLLMVAGMDKYYQVARCYRDEMGRPDRQAEFSQLDIEMSFTTREGVMKLVEDLLKYACPKSIFAFPNERFPVLSYLDAQEQYGTDKPNTGDFLWVVDFPLFLINDSGDPEAAHHPFTMPQDVKDIYKNPLGAVGLSYDLVYCGAEIGGGSIRIHDATLQKYVFQNVLKLPIEDIDYLISALESGCPPHGGFALGIDRFLAKIFDTKSIRDVIAFPKSGDGKDLMSGAPSPLDSETKKYYNL